MAITAEFVDGPARGTSQSYPDLSSALPSLWWSSEGSPRTEATYHRMGGRDQCAELAGLVGQPV
jgi:hypothetical protein